jgi:hypothetical protein
MGSLTETFQNIADILSFETQHSDLEKRLSNPKFNWDLIVMEGSKHLVLPALYSRLKTKSLLLLLPTELNEYLEKLTTINRNRNASITKQTLKISELLKEHSINHVFLKGTALLASNYYDDSAERMIGDIDILIDKKQIQKTFKIIESTGYSSAKTTLANTFFDHRHMPRLISKDDICAIELHYKLFTKFKDKNLDTEDILNQKNTKFAINIPSNKHLFLHNILNHQINNNGNLYKTISFRSFYDSTLLLKRHDFRYLIKDIQKKPYKDYLYSLNHFLKPTELLEIRSEKTFINYLTTNSFLHKTYIKIVKINLTIYMLTKRAIFFLSNSDYRKAILNDRKRVINHLKNILLSKR